MECVSLVSFSMILSGKPTRRFCPTRGLRQEDPLSPYFFLLIIDVLSRMIKIGIQEKALRGIKLSMQCPMLSHLLLLVIISFC